MANKPSSLHVAKKCLDCEKDCKIESLGEMYYCQKFKKKKAIKKDKKKK